MLTKPGQFRDYRNFKDCKNSLGHEIKLDCISSTRAFKGIRPVNQTSNSHRDSTRRGITDRAPHAGPPVPDSGGGRPRSTGFRGPDPPKKVDRDERLCCQREGREGAHRGRSRGGRWRHGLGRASFDSRVKVAVDVSTTRRGVARTRREIKLSLGSGKRGEERREEEWWC